ncbi:MAG: stomatin-like protein [Spirochaetota bacterium]
MIPLYVILGIVGFFILISLIRSFRVVPARTTLVIERLGKYAKTLDAGFHVLVPFIDKAAYRHSLKERAIDVPSQTCFTQDNVQVTVDGVLYFQIIDPKKASYGIKDYEYATIQLAQTTMRSVIGKLELDKTFEERENINAEIVRAVDEASDLWGINVTRYEVQNISVPDNVLKAMEIQMKAEREKRAEVARSIGIMESKINYSQAAMEEAINKSEGVRQKLINEAEGKAQEILSVARATAASISKVAEAIELSGGEEAVALRIAEEFIGKLHMLAKNSTQLVLPMDLTDLDSVLETVKRMITR